MSENDRQGAGSDFEKTARAKRPGFMSEFLGFLKHNKKWWMLPMLTVILILGVLVLLGGTPFAPFIYTLF